jgi:tetratricopeptide (TPR) repeat protein
VATLLYERAEPGRPFEDSLREQTWFGGDDEYALLFETLCDKPSQRRIQIERCISDARPGWGYIYLADLISRGYFNVVFTPNFDDLLNEACFSFAAIRPIVCAHDSAVADVRVTSHRPKIIKLHGDFLYDSIKNTLRETEFLETNMREKLKQFGQEYGLIVVGYGGNDRSIMDVLETMLNSGAYFPHGLYWCYREADKLSRRAQRIARRENVFFVSVPGFDELMAETHKRLGLALPETLSDPYKTTTDRLNGFIDLKTRLTHPIIQEDIARIESEVQRFEKALAGGDYDRLVPYTFLGARAFDQSRDEAAVAYLEKALKQDPGSRETLLILSRAHSNLRNADKALAYADRLLEQNPADFRARVARAHALEPAGAPPKALVSAWKLALENVTLDDLTEVYFVNLQNAHLKAKQWDDALAIGEQLLARNPEEVTVIINNALALVGLARDAEAKQLVEERLRAPERWNALGALTRACVLGLLGQKADMLVEIRKALAEGKERTRTRLLYDPDFDNFRTDAEFLELVGPSPTPTADAE